MRRKTSAFFAHPLRALVSQSPNESANMNVRSGRYGVVAVMKNGDGPTVWVRHRPDAYGGRKRPACFMPAKLNQGRSRPRMSA